MPTSASHAPGRPSNREVENENQRPAQGGNQGDGKAPRPATEPRGAEDSSDSPKTRTDPGSGEA
ncbi:hypothetical protein SAMN02799626_04542 [Caulobacter sp. UNC279MFTsu5.1]|nr:hypothetical protein [Caulobacter sp. UNC279MFTsu5.1]SFK53489.1 hypothetical protein SAMN02799626_04542 [Caulobacter sp. UNC279MFTsu5.1]